MHIVYLMHVHHEVTALHVPCIKGHPEGMTEGARNTGCIE